MQKYLGNWYIELSLNQIGLIYMTLFNDYPVFVFRWYPLGLNILGRMLINLDND